MIYTSRPPRSRVSARLAWDLHTKDEPRAPKAMWFARFGLHDTAWVMEYENGDFDEIDSLCIRDQINNPWKYERG